MQSFQSNVPIPSSSSRFGIFTTRPNGLPLRSLSSLEMTLGARRGCAEVLSLDKIVEVSAVDKIVCKVEAKSEVEESGD